MVDTRTRNDAIRWAHRSGASLRYLAAAHGLSPSRVHQIVWETERTILQRLPKDKPPELPSWLAKLSARSAKG